MSFWNIVENKKYGGASTRGATSTWQAIWYTSSIR